VKASGGMAITPTGEALRIRVEEHIEALEDAIKYFSGGGVPFTVNVMPWLASSWLMPRLHRFTHQHPEAVIRIETSSGLSDLKNGETAAALRFGEGKWHHVNAEWLFNEWVAPVAHPNLIERLHLEADKPERWPLLADPDDLWPLWFSYRQKIQGSLERQTLNTFSGVNLQDADTLAEAAYTGLGVILGRFTQVAPLLREHKLDMLTTGWMQVPKSHYLVRAAGREPHPLFDSFRQWLHEEIQSDRQGITSSYLME